MEFKDVFTQDELAAALEDGKIPILRGNAAFEVFDSAQVRACGSVQVRAYDSAQVTASEYVAVSIHGKGVKAKGGKQIKIPVPATVREWCDFYGVQVKRGIATLFKAVRPDYKSAHDMAYMPGSTPSAPDWDGGKEECGGGLHFSPGPWMAMRFDPEATKFVACPVKLTEIRVHKDTEYPDKVKAPRVCAPVWECDIDGNPIAVVKKNDNA